jgi:hypothetical protein
MIRALMIAAPLLALAACDSDTPAPVAEEAAAPATFPAGEWEVTFVTESLRSADHSTPATMFKEGVPFVTKACAAAGPKPDPVLFIEKGDKCTAQMNYAKDGRLNIGYTCTRPGHEGEVRPTLDGKYDATTFEAEMSTGTYFSGNGDYVMTQHLKGKRLGDCAPGAKATG